MNRDSFGETPVPILTAFKLKNRGIKYIQNETPSYSARQTIEKLQTARIVPTEWPPFPPDLSPIENSWKSKKKTFFITTFLNLTPKQGCQLRGFVSYDKMLGT